MNLNKSSLVLALVFSLSLAQLFAEPRAFPVPFKGNQDSNITFADLPGEGSIQIFDVSGEKVTELAVGPGVGLLGWNVTNSSGKKLASGVYFALITGAKKRLKLVVIR